MRPHPATVEWLQRRELCERCQFLDQSEGEKNERIMRCRASSRPIKAGAFRPYCIDMRLPGAECGPLGLKFTPR